jgi:hypothetical protein
VERAELLASLALAVLDSEPLAEFCDTLRRLLLVLVIVLAHIGALIFVTVAFLRLL